MTQLPFKVLPTDRMLMSGSPANGSDICSRCAIPIPEQQVPLLLFRNGRFVLQYCENCTGFKSDVDDYEEDYGRT